MMGPMEARCFPPFKRAAAEAAAFGDFRVRLLAQVEGDPRLTKEAITANLDPLTTEVAKHYGATQVEAKYLSACVGIRNKLFHLELSRMTGRVAGVVDLKDQLVEAGVWSANLETGEVARVADTSSMKEAIFGWMLEATQSGAFAAVEEIMITAQEMLKSLRDAKLYAQLQASSRSRLVPALELVQYVSRAAPRSLPTSFASCSG